MTSARLLHSFATTGPRPLCERRRRGRTAQVSGRHTAARLGCGVAALLTFAGACGGDSKDNGSGGATTTSIRPSATTVSLRVSSSITEGQTLGAALPWTATTEGSAQVTSVDFLVDGQVKWHETETPYGFNGDDGLLPPWLLGSGTHRLTVRANASAGTPATATANVTVTPVPTGDATLAGTYERLVTEGDIARVAPYRTKDKGAFGELPATGQWTMKISAEGLVQLVDPSGGIFYEPYTSSGHMLTLYGPAVWLQANPRDPFLFCEPEAASDYTWKVETSSVVIAEASQACADRDQVFVGTWQRRS